MPDPATLSATRLRALLNYDPDTGIFTWRTNRTKTALAGTRAGSASRSGYVTIRVDGMRWQAHRLAWLHVLGVHPLNQIDHINGIRDDNRWTNLREATLAQNHQNLRHACANNRTGYLGVAHDGRGRYRAQIVISGRQHYLGRFNSAEDAFAAYVAAKRTVHPYGVL